MNGLVLASPVHAWAWARRVGLDAWALSHVDGRARGFAGTDYPIHQTIVCRVHVRIFTNCTHTCDTLSSSDSDLATRCFFSSLIVKEIEFSKTRVSIVNVFVLVVDKLYMSYYGSMIADNKS